MYIYYKWNKKYDSTELAGVPMDRILYYELEARFTIESDDNQIFTEYFVPIYSIVKSLKDSKQDLIEIDLEGWSCNPFLVIEKQDSRVRVKNDFIDFECDKKVYELVTEQFIFLVERDIREMGFNTSE